MLTPWGEALDKNAVLQEYPRPQLVRESYYNLNGLGADTRRLFKQRTAL